MAADAETRKGNGGSRTHLYVSSRVVDLDLVSCIPPSVRKPSNDLAQTVFGTDLIKAIRIYNTTACKKLEVSYCCDAAHGAGRVDDTYRRSTWESHTWWCLSLISVSTLQLMPTNVLVSDYHIAPVTLCREYL